MLYLLFIAVTIATADEKCPEVISHDCIPMQQCVGKGNKTYTHHIPYPDDCHKYYKCLRGLACLLCCPRFGSGQNRLVFNPEEQVCDWPFKIPKPEAKCYDIFPPTTPPEPTTQPTTPPQPTTQPTTSPQPTTLPTTPSKSTTPSTTTSKPTSLPDDNPTHAPIVSNCPPNGNVKIQHETDCNKYYVCRDGMRSPVRICPDALVFNPIIGACDLKEHYHCK